jgi:hypothetical protein
VPSGGILFDMERKEVRRVPTQDPHHQMALFADYFVGGKKLAGYQFANMPAALADLGQDFFKKMRATFGDNINLQEALAHLMNAINRHYPELEMK